MPYSPMHGPRKNVTQEDMWETLKRHLPPDSPLRDAGREARTPKAEPAVALPPIEWQKPVRTGENSGYLLSQCGHFSISKDSVRGKPMYSAWRLIPDQPGQLIGIRLTRAEAERLCEDNR